MKVDRGSILADSVQVAWQSVSLWERQNRVASGLTLAWQGMSLGRIISQGLMRSWKTRKSWIFLNVFENSNFPACRSIGKINKVRKFLKGHGNLLHKYLYIIVCVVQFNIQSIFVKQWCSGRSATSLEFMLFPAWDTSDSDRSSSLNFELWHIFTFRKHLVRPCYLNKYWFCIKPHSTFT